MSNYYSFVGGDRGQWQVRTLNAVAGATLAPVTHIEMINAPVSALTYHGSWVLQGFTSNLRYTERQEVTRLRAVQEGLDRPDALCAAMIPIKKSADWWALPQDERRAIFEEQSHHTAIGLDYLPAIARQLHHCRDLGEPFDFITWFEFAPEHTGAFDAMLVRLRASKEWEYVEREVDIRLTKIIENN